MAKSDYTRPHRHGISSPCLNPCKKVQFLKWPRYPRFAPWDFPLFWARPSKSPRQDTTDWQSSRQPNLERLHSRKISKIASKYLTKKRHASHTVIPRGNPRHPLTERAQSPRQPQFTEAPPTEHTAEHDGTHGGTRRKLRRNSKQMNDCVINIRILLVLVD